MLGQVVFMMHPLTCVCLEQSGKALQTKMEEVPVNK